MVVRAVSTDSGAGLLEEGGIDGIAVAFLGQNGDELLPSRAGIALLEHGKPKLLSESHLRQQPIEALGG